MRLPDWLRVKDPTPHSAKAFLRQKRLHTVCEEARCPNKAHCFSKPTATFMILGDVCTRNCSFCAVKSGTVKPVDPEEPIRIAEAVKEMALRYVVITSVTRDDLADGGAGHFANTIKAIRAINPQVKVEVLTPDFEGSITALDTVLNAQPDVFNHNMETVSRLYKTIRSKANYERSLDVLANAKKLSPKTKTKSGLMLGLGETLAEVIEVLKDLRAVGCDMLTIGQYLQPSKQNIEVKEYIHPQVFEYLRKIALDMGFEVVASAPLVRSSMNAEELFSN